MTTRLRWLADGIAAVSVLLFAAAEWKAYSVGAGEGMSLGGIAAEELRNGSLPFVLGFGGVGWILARRVPHNAIGWCFAVGGLLWAVGAIGDAWTATLTADDRPGAAARVLANLSIHGWLLSMPFSVQLPLLLLPNGRLLSPRWRVPVRVVAAGMALGLLGFATMPGLIDGTDPSDHLVNPIGVRWLGPVPHLVALTGAGLLLVGMLCGAVAVILRFRRSRGVERQQMRWVAAGGCCVLTSPIVALTPGLPDSIDAVIGTLGIVAVPVCVGIAVLRYRLYDLGRLVSRTVSYAVVTALLLGLYLTLVTTAARLAPGSSSLAVAAATLAAAALFQPLRRRVQSAVDHRFNRARYDADRTVEEFRRRLRDEVDLAAVRADLLHVVEGTVQPAAVGLWLRQQT